MTRTGKRTVQFDGRPIWAEVSLGALTHNLRAIRSHVNPRRARGPRRKVLAVIKSNAYGHGIVPVARALSRARADWFGVTCSAEGAELRESGIREPVLILTGFWAGEEQRILEHNLTPAVMRPEQLRVAGAGRRALAQGAPQTGRFSPENRLGHEPPGHFALGNSGVRARAGRLPASAACRHVHAHCFVGSVHHRADGRAGKNI